MHAVLIIVPAILLLGCGSSPVDSMTRPEEASPKTASITQFYARDPQLPKGEKTVLGVRIPADGGQEDAERVLGILARHPSTAKFISTKLAKKFVAEIQKH